MEEKYTVGTRFGHWVLLNEETGLCRCDCGTIRIVSIALLKFHVSISCGCVQSRAKDLTNRRFGKLLVIEPIGKDDKDSVIWRCKCDCGKTKTFACYLLTTGRRKSCGCMGIQTKHLQPSKTYIEGTCVEYMFSDKPARNNTSGYKGVAKKREKWQATITVGGKTQYLGSFKEKEDAIEKRKEAISKVREHLQEVMEESVNNCPGPRQADKRKV